MLEGSQVSRLLKFIAGVGSCVDCDDLSLRKEGEREGGARREGGGMVGDGLKSD